MDIMKLMRMFNEFWKVEFLEKAMEARHNPSSSTFQIWDKLLTVIHGNHVASLLDDNYPLPWAEISDL